MSATVQVKYSNGRCQVWFTWFPSVSNDHPGSSPNDNILTTNGEESRAKIKSDEGFSLVSTNTIADPGRNILAEGEKVSDFDDEANIPPINNIESLERGIVTISKNKAKAPYTIVLIGETGVGKTSVLCFIANVFAGNDIDHYDFDILDHNDEQGGSKNQSQTISARLYEFTSKNGIMVRILDTPGLGDARGIQQDELHKKSIVDHIEKVTDSITAVLVLVNGTVPRVSVGTESALSTVSAIFHRTLSKNVAFLLTNTSNQLYQNFSRDILPEVFMGAPEFLLNNPTALQRKCLERKGGSNTSQMTHFREAVKASEQDALEMLVDLFDWLDALGRSRTRSL